MKNCFYSLLLVSAAFFSSCSGSGKNHLEEALSWSAGDGIAFDNWEQVNADFGWTKEEFYSQDWVPRTIDVATGEEIPEEIEKDNFSPYARRLYIYAAMPDRTKRLGFEYPELQWEAESNQVSIFKFSAGYNKKPLEELMAELLYEKKMYRGCVLYSGGGEPGIYFERNLAWMEGFKAVAYCEAENVLLLGYDSSSVHQTIDAHFDGKSLLEQDGIRELASHLDGIESVILGKLPVKLNYLLRMSLSHDPLDVLRADFLTDAGINEAAIAALHRPVYIAVGERKGGESVSVLQFASEEEAEADLETRKAIFEKGRSWRKFQPLKENFFEPEVKAERSCLVFEWKMLPSSIELFDMIATHDLAWAIGPG